MQNYWVVALLCAAISAFATMTVGQASEPTRPDPNETFYTSFDKMPDVAALTALGRAIFFDASLSASGKISCATCHSPQHAFGPANDLAVQVAGTDLKSPGMRAVPSLRYLQNVPRFTEHFYDNEGDDSIDQGPSGGHAWDGRAFSAHDQARLPLLSEFEMANRSVDAVVAKISRATYAPQMQAAFGPRIFENQQASINALALALEVFQQSPRDFYPYDSKYDFYLRGQTQLASRELNGLKLFNDKEKGNCASCHPSSIKGGTFPQFTDYGFAALAVPRNRNIAANHDAKYFDLGLCGPLRTDLQDKHEYCGLFRAPSLRNVALRKRFFHNGVFTTLEQVLEFYVDRERAPEKFYSRDTDGRINTYDDLPAAYHVNVNRDAPFNRSAQDAPALSQEEIADVIAFLQTLTDGYALPKTQQ